MIPLVEQIAQFKYVFLLLSIVSLYIPLTDNSGFSLFGDSIILVLLKKIAGWSVPSLLFGLFLILDGSL